MLNMHRSCLIVIHSKNKDYCMRKIFTVLLLTNILIQACTPREIPLNTTNTPEIQSSMKVETRMPALPSPDIVINALKLQRESVMTVGLGNIIAVTPPPTPVQWRISYAESVVELLTSKEILEDATTREWLFRTSATGSTDIRLTSIPPVCTDPLPCPPAPPQVITFTLEVK